MHRKIQLILLLLMCFSSRVVESSEITVSARILPYEDALKGFLSVSNPDFKRLILSELKTPSFIKNTKKYNPPLILTIGHDALLNVNEIKDIPVIYVMVLNPQSLFSQPDNFYDINMKLDIFTKPNTDLNNIGLIYNPDNKGEFVKNAADYFHGEKYSHPGFLRKIR